MGIKTEYALSPDFKIIETFGVGEMISQREMETYKTVHLPYLPCTHAASPLPLRFHMHGLNQPQVENTQKKMLCCGWHS